MTSRVPTPSLPALDWATRRNEVPPPQASQPLLKWFPCQQLWAPSWGSKQPISGEDAHAKQLTVSLLICWGFPVPLNSIQEATTLSYSFMNANTHPGLWTCVLFPNSHLIQIQFPQRGLLWTPESKSLSALFPLIFNNLSKYKRYSLMLPLHYTRRPRRTVTKALYREPSTQELFSNSLKLCE